MTTIKFTRVGRIHREIGTNSFAIEELMGLRDIDPNKVFFIPIKMELSANPVDDFFGLDKIFGPRPKAGESQHYLHYNAVEDKLYHHVENGMGYDENHEISFMRYTKWLEFKSVVGYDYEMHQNQFYVVALVGDSRTGLWSFHNGDSDCRAHYEPVSDRTISFLTLPNR